MQNAPALQYAVPHIQSSDSDIIPESSEQSGGIVGCFVGYVVGDSVGDFVGSGVGSATVPSQTSLDHVILKELSAISLLD
jgi:hypothetical protein